MSTDDSFDEDAAYRKLAARYSVSTMSNAKWLRLFRAVIASGVVIERAEWRYLYDEHPAFLPFPQEHNLCPTRFADGRFQPVGYRWIESILVPREYQPTPGIGLRRQQDITSLRATIESAGLFELERAPAACVSLPIAAEVRLGAVAPARRRRSRRCAECPH